MAKIRSSVIIILLRVSWLLWIEAEDDTIRTHASVGVSVSYCMKTLPLDSSTAQGMLLQRI
jgi:hypothetical protein